MRQTDSSFSFAPSFTRRSVRGSWSARLALWGALSLLGCSNDDPSGGGTGGGGAGTGATTGSGGDSATTSGGSGGSGATGGNGASAGTGGSGTVGTGGAQASGGSDFGAGGEYPYPVSAPDESGADLWLRYPVVPVEGRRAEYEAAFTNVVNVGAGTASLDAAAEELVRGLSGLLGKDTPLPVGGVQGSGDVILGTVDAAPVADYGLAAQVTPLGPDGYLVTRVESGDGYVTLVTGNTPVGVLYGAFALLRHLQTHSGIDQLTLSAAPKIQDRILNHWDNLDGTVERGYAGSSIWDWGTLPTITQRYIDYARANASIGINGTVLTNVNATKGINPNMWTQRDEYFPKVQAIADALRPYGIRVYLTAPFDAGGSSDPNVASNRQWWVDRMDELYGLIPDFGGLLIKASSEGEPGPLNATHAEGANMLAEAIGDRGILLYRAFVYGENLAADRIRQAYDQFGPLDGDFLDNVFVQAKNGPLDFQPREPIHPLFGGMPQTNVAMEFQITKEYLGQDTHLAYVGPWYEEVLKTDTHATGAGATVARVVDGTVFGNQKTAIAGVSNVGDDTNWTGSHFNQANWYAFGRMAWDPDASSETLAEEWVRLTLSNDPNLVQPVVQMMMSSHEALVNYMTPLGLVHIMADTHHYGPAPWANNLSRAEWNPVYYHEANMQGIGFDRTATGSNAVEQYAAPLTMEYGSLDTVPNELLLFFHRVGWDHTLDTGRTVWEELVHRYSLGVDDMGGIKELWAAAEGRIDQQRFQEIAEFLQIQHWEARWWRDACLSYFSAQSGQPIGEGYAQPHESLQTYQGLTCPPNRDKPRCEPVYGVDASPAIVE